MKSLIKLGLSLAILGLAFRHVDFSAVTGQFHRLDLLSLATSLFFLTLSSLLVAIRWRAVTMAVASNTPALPLFLRSFYRGAFLNQGLPTTFGGDALRIIDLSRAIGSKREAAGTVLLDRVIGLCGLLVINLLMLPLSLRLFPTSLALTVAAVSAGGLLTIAILLALPWQRVAHHHPGLALIAEFNTFGRRVLAHPRRLLVQCVLSIAVHACAILSLFVLARQFGVEADFATHLVIQPSVFIVTLLPISLAGWGVREGTMAALFATIGIAAPAVMATSLTFGAVALVATLPGLYFVIRSSRLAGQTIEQ